MNNLIVDKKVLKNIDLVIFDKDGTLIDIHHYWCSMIKIRSKFLLNRFNINSEELYYKLISVMGIDVSTNKMKTEGPVGIKPRAFIINTAFNCLKEEGVKCFESDVSCVFKEVDEYSKKKMTNLIKPLPGVEYLLMKLKQSGVFQTIATTDLSNRAVIAMESINFNNYFSLIVGADAVDNAKPSPDLVNYICKKLNIEKEKTVVIGDSIVDLNMAKNSGTHFIGVKTGLYSNDFIKNSEFIIENFEQIKIEQ